MKSRTKIWLIVAASLVLIGGILFASVMMSLGGDFAQLSTSKYETNKYKITEEFKNISVLADTADIVFLPAEDATTSITCYEPANAKHSVNVENDTLTIKLVDTRKWYEYIGIYTSAPKITVNLPRAEYASLFVKVDTGDVKLEDISAEKVDIESDTGDVILKKLAVTGEISVENDTGDVKMENVVTTGSILIESDTGDVHFKGCDAANLKIETDTGDVIGNLLTDKVFIVETDTGDVEVPKTVTGGRCEINTDTGDIEIRIG